MKSSLIDKESLLKLIQDVFDGEASCEQKKKLKYYLDNCKNCQSIFKAEQKMQAFFKEKLKCNEAPPELEKSIRKGIFELKNFVFKKLLDKKCKKKKEN